MVCDQNSVLTTGLEGCANEVMGMAVFIGGLFMSLCSRAREGAHLASKPGNACFGLLLG